MASKDKIPVRKPVFKSKRRKVAPELELAILHIQHAILNKKYTDLKANYDQLVYKIAEEMSAKLELEFDNFDLKKRIEKQL